MIEHIKGSLLEAQRALDDFIANAEALRSVEAAAETLIKTYERKGRVYSCGNGGSMCDAMHFAEELTGRYRNNRSGLGAIAISDPSHMSCVANDFGYDYVFSRYIESHGREGDSLIAISTSGKSPTILNAAKAAREQGVSVIALTGKTGSPLESLADVCICAPGGSYADRVQELHIKVLHILIELVERRFFPENYEQA
ncbi:SIS domain-containing protein [Hahella sp. KA22]|uniref:SIS domain-containing protein n=1 Tax=Hahella sp. KA22 TaxID=1628392 RepID=UPI000FDD870C|nr:SIS domain-containing protein [Hahella sp. KA22]AZZ93645.1 SIS domain-containing protein [Hahella sp. KA22]QAY57020.1 SIS domain-containing protein [Hahella sp. KA22]